MNTKRTLHVDGLFLNILVYSIGLGLIDRFEKTTLYIPILNVFVIIRLGRPCPCRVIKFVDFRPLVLEW
jgi:hypothetical protein